MNIVRLVLEVSRPIKSVDILSMINRLSEVKSIKSILVKFDKISSESQSFILILEGDNIDYNIVIKTLEELNISVVNVIEIKALTS
jgi:hypothetical protein